MYCVNYLNWLQFPNSKKNSFRGNYMRKYSLIPQSGQLFLGCAQPKNCFTELKPFLQVRILWLDSSGCASRVLIYPTFARRPYFIHLGFYKNENTLVGTVMLQNWTTLATFLEDMIFMQAIQSPWIQIQILDFALQFLKWNTKNQQLQTIFFVFRRDCHFSLSMIVVKSTLSPGSSLEEKHIQMPYRLKFPRLASSILVVHLVHLR